MSQELVFQKYDPDWDSSIDVEDGTELNNKDKLKAIVLEKPAETVSHFCMWFSFKLWHMSLARI